MLGIIRQEQRNIVKYALGNIYVGLTFTDRVTIAHNRQEKVGHDVGLG